jgi:uncharacterized protein YidB (DUF937 family)
MGLLDAILQQAGSAALGGGREDERAGGIADLVMKNPQIIAAALSMLNPKDTSVGGGGGLADVIGAFNKGGLGDVMSSWVSGGPNKPWTRGRSRTFWAPDVLGQFARQAGIGHGDASSVLASILPELVNQMTPQGPGAAGRRRSRARSARCSASSEAIRIG